MKETENKNDKTGISFDYRSIGDIDLSEAEKIANEEILFLSEDDLIDGLEDFELIPLKSETDMDEYIPAGKETPANRNLSAGEEQPSAEEAAPMPPDDPDHPVYDELFSDSTPGSDESEPENPDVLTADSENHESEEIAEPDNSESAPVDSEEPVPEEVSWQDVNETDISASDENFSDESPANGQESGEISDLEIDFDVIDAEEEDEIEYTSVPEPVYHNEGVQTGADPAVDENFHLIETKEILPDEISGIKTNEVEVRFIDDDLVDNFPGILSEPVAEEEIFSRLTRGISQVIIGSPLILTDSTHDHRKKFFFIEPDAALDSLGRLFDDSGSGESLFRDDEIDYIHSEIIRDDYKDYLRNIDVFHETIGKKYISETVDISGLTRYEIEEIEKELFEREFEGVDLDQLFDFYITDKMFRGISPSVKGTYTYIQKSIGTLDDDEKISIEADITSENAVIFEEDIEDIRSLYRIHTGSEIDLMEKPLRADRHEKPEEGELYDITDRVVIIEDDYDVDRFVADIPEHKRNDIRKLLKYLDGLFEKLPESVINNFASSEYFNLYQKVLNQLEE